MHAGEVSQRAMLVFVVHVLSLYATAHTTGEGDACTLVDRHTNVTVTVANSARAMVLKDTARDLDLILSMSIYGCVVVVGGRGGCVMGVAGTLRCRPIQRNGLSSFISHRQFLASLVDISIYMNTCF